jgi:hypothetical protein
MSDLMRCQLIGGALGVFLATLLWFGLERWRQVQNVRALARAAEEDAVIAEFNKSFGPGIVRVETAHDPHHFWYAVTFDDGTTKRWYPGAMRLVHD